MQGFRKFGFFMAIGDVSLWLGMLGPTGGSHWRSLTRGKFLRGDQGPEDPLALSIDKGGPHRVVGQGVGDRGQDHSLIEDQHAVGDHAAGDVHRVHEAVIVINRELFLELPEVLHRLAGANRSARNEAYGVTMPFVNRARGVDGAVLVRVLVII